MAVTLVACGATTPSRAVNPRVPLPAGALPSGISKMVCASEAQREINAALGTTAVVGAPTWSGHLYSCRYSYPTGSFALSVKELSSWPQTFAYFRGLGAALGNSSALRSLGQGGFVTARRIGGGSKGLEGVARGYLEPSRPVRRAADVVIRCGRDDRRCHPRLLGGRLTDRARPLAPPPERAVTPPGASRWAKCCLRFSCERRGGVGRTTNARP